MMETYADGFKVNFNEQEEFLNFLNYIERTSDWTTIKAKALRLFALKEDKDIEDYKKKGIDEGILMDTVKNTELILKAGKNYYPVRNCAIKTLLERAGINGSGLRKLNKPVYAKVLNEFLKVTNGIALLRIVEGKVSATLGGDAHEYAILNTEQIFLRSVAYLSKTFKNYRYLSGFYEHHLVSSVWEINDDQLLETYQKEIETHGKKTDEMIPLLRITTSDIGSSGANIYPILSFNNSIIPLGNPIRLEHKGQANIQKFENQLSMIYGKYQVAMQGLTKLLSIPIQNPIYCFKNVCKKLSIPMKYTIEAVDLFQAQYGIEPCTAHDIYYGISEIIYMFSYEGETGSRITQMEETIARAISINWKDYDIPGNI